jgi:hypothetical protein
LHDILVWHLAFSYLVLSAYLGMRQPQPVLPTKPSETDYMHINLALGYAQ